MMIEILLGITQIATLLWLYLERRKRIEVNKMLLKVADLTNTALVAQKSINETQFVMNEGIANNLEILGVHTRLIKPSVGMEAEAFLRWHNRKEENG